jgi:two-component system sensor histidine kinase KdpD
MFAREFASAPARFDRITLLQFAAGAVAVALATAIVWGISQVAPLPRPSVVLLAAVVTTALLCGLVPSLFTAALSISVSCFLFYPPIYDFDVDALQDVIELIVFSFVGVLTSSLANELRRQRRDATRGQAMMTNLYSFSRKLAGIADLNELLDAILDHMRTVSNGGVALLVPDGGRLAPHAGGAGVPPDPVRDVAGRLWAADGDRAEVAANGARAGWRLRVLRGRTGRIALMAFEAPADGKIPPEYLDALLDQSAIAIERAQLALSIEDARVDARTEKLREALLNSISHDLQTPLASIIGSATAMQSFGPLYDSGARAELVATIREEAERLEHFITNVLDLTRIRAGEIQPRLELVELADIVNSALRKSHRSLAKHEVAVSLPDDLAMLRLDLFLMEHALINLLENAAKYSPPGSKIEISARQAGADVEVDIRDHGQGIVAAELPNIFDRLYRSQTNDAKLAGTGLGLPICRAFVEANLGRVEAYSDGPGAGATFRLTLPAAEPVPSEMLLTDD